MPAPAPPAPAAGLGDIPDAWAGALAATVAAPAIARLNAFLAAEEAAGVEVFPPRADRFRALALTPPDAVRAVILGQDPYHGPGQAHGLSFSVRPGVRPPPSLVNIFKELAADLDLARPAHGFLEHWARQGVLLLNTALTVRSGAAGSHRLRGWEVFTDAVIAHVGANEAPVAFLLWGAHAQQKAPLIEAAGAGRHLILRSAHPSPLSARHGFLGSRPFSRTNAFLECHGRPPIDWSLLDRVGGAG